MKADRLEQVIESIAVLPFGAGLFMLMFATLIWFKTGEWSTPSGWLIASLFGPSAWVNSPTNWLGLHKLVGGLLDWPFWLLLVLVGVFLRWLADYIVLSIRGVEPTKVSEFD